MDLETRARHAHASVEDVLAMLLDPAFREEAGRASDAADQKVEIERDPDGGATVRIERSMPSDELSPLVRNLVGESVRIRQTETWAPATDDTRVAELVVDVLGQPAGMTGSITLAPYDEGSEMVVEGEVRVTIPLLGRKLEPDVHRAIKTVVDAEAEAGLRWLDR